MSVLNIFLFALFSFVFLNYLNKRVIERQAKEALAKGNTKKFLLLSFTEFARNYFLFITLSAGIALGISYWLTMGGAFNEAEAQQKLDKIDLWSGYIGNLSADWGLFFTIFISAVLLICSHWKSKASAEKATKAEFLRQFKELEAKRKSGTLKKLPPTPQMTKIEEDLVLAGEYKKLLENELLRQKLKNLNVSEIGRSLVEQKKIIENLKAVHKVLDFQRRMNLTIDPVTLGISEPKTRKERLLTFLVSRGLFSTLSFPGRILAVFGALLLIPSMLVIASAPVLSDLEEKSRVLRSEINQFRIEASLEELDKEYQGIVEPAEDLTASNADQNPELSDEALAIELGRVFESEILPNQVIEREYSRRSLDLIASDFEKNRRNQARQAVLEAVEKGAPREAGLKSETSPNRQTVSPALKAYQRANLGEGPVTVVGQRAAENFIDLSKNNKPLWDKIRIRYEEYIFSFRQPIAPERLQGILISEIISRGLGSVPTNLSWVGKEAVGWAESIGTDTLEKIYDTNYKSWIVELNSSASFEAAIEATLERTPEILKRPQKDALSDITRNYLNEVGEIKIIGNFEIAITKTPRPGVNVRATREILSEIFPEMQDGSRSPRIANVYTEYADLFPGIEGQEKTTRLYKEKNRFGVNGSPSRIETVKSKHEFHKSRSYSGLAVSPKIGGILIGKRPENENAQLDITDFDWTLEGDKTFFVLKLGDGSKKTLGPYKSAISHLALGYAADGRVAAVTMISMVPLFENKIFLHPVLQDTGLGCRMIQFDEFAFEFLSSPDDSLNLKNALPFRPLDNISTLPISEDIQDLRILWQEESKKAKIKIKLYEYAWALRFSQLLIAISNDKPIIPTPRMTKEEINALKKALEEADKILLDWDLVLSLWENFPFEEISELKKKPEYFEAKLVEHIDNCKQEPSLNDFKNCLQNEIYRHIPNYYSKKINFWWTAPPQDQHLKSGIRELPYRVDNSFDWLSPENQTDPWPFKFLTLYAFSAPYFADKKIPWYKESKKRIEFIDKKPWEFYAVTAPLNWTISKALKSEDFTIAASIFSDIREFTLLQRFFRAAFNGNLGPRFPVQKLARLAEDTAAEVNRNVRTLRWSPRPGFYDNNSSLKNIDLLRQLRQELGIVEDERLAQSLAENVCPQP